VDFDGDGHMDILSGSWPGHLYFFKGQGKGKFAAGVKLQDAEGKDIKLGRASTVFACDWRATGKLDLLIGDVDGNVWLMPNEGTATAAKYGKAQQLEVDGVSIKAANGDSHPVAADWDKDGKLDLVLGTGAGSVLFYRNVGTRVEPRLAAPQTLVPEPVSAPNSNEPPKEGQWGMRAKICVTDWNGDGWPDLLVGDFQGWQGPAPKLSEEDKEKQKIVEKKFQEIVGTYAPLAQKIEKLQEPAADESAEAKGKREKDLAVLNKQLEPIEKELQKAGKEMQRFQPPYHYQGNVWLFLRRPPPPSK